MASDQFGNYIADIWPVPVSPLPTSICGGSDRLSGSGSPEGVVVGNVGQTYWDYTNKILWTKDTGDGTNTGWYQTVG